MGTYAIQVQSSTKPKSLARLFHKKEAFYVKPITSSEEILGNTVEIECQVEPETVEVEWFFNDKQITQNEKKKIVKNGNSRKIEIEKFDKNDQGTYFVKIIQNDEFYSTEPLRIAQLTGTEKVDVGMNDIKSKRGEKVKIECKLGKQSPDV